MMYNFALIAQNLKNSATPVMIQTLMDDLSLTHTFEILDVAPEELKGAICKARHERNGIIITMPHKQAAMQYMDSLDESAVKCCSCNVVQIQNEKITGFNTDGWGFIAALKYFGHTMAGKRVVMLGAGGVAASIAYNLVKSGVDRVDVLNIIPEQTAVLCARYPGLLHARLFGYKELKSCCNDADLFINASVLGQLGYDDFEDLSFLERMKPESIVYDVNYHNPNAVLVSKAKDLGLHAYDGKSMNACQGLRIIEIFTGRAPSRKGLEQLLAKTGAVSEKKVGVSM